MRKIGAKVFSSELAASEGGGFLLKPYSGTSFT